MTTGRQERVVLGGYLLAWYMAVTSFMFGETFRTASHTVPPNPGLAWTTLVVAMATLAVTVALAVRFFGLAEGTRMMVREAWPALLAGGGLALITGTPLRASVPPHLLWLVPTAAYGSGLFIIYLLGHRAPRPSRPVPGARADRSER